MSPAVYISGPMSGLPDFNYPRFHAEAARLRALGWQVINPAENPEQPDWHAYMRLSVAQVAQSTMVATLPGWTGSKGARIEVELAERLGLPIVSAEEIEHGPEAAQRAVCGVLGACRPAMGVDF